MLALLALASGVNLSVVEVRIVLCKPYFAVVFARHDDG